MKIGRFFDTDNYKGTKNYLNSQKKYEIIRTIVYFGISISLYVAGYVTTKTNMNLLTVAAILGCLPGCKSLVGMIMFLRFKSLPENVAEDIEKHTEELVCLCDMVFTTYDKTFQIGHMILRGNTVIGYALPQKKYDEAVLIKHLTDTLALDGITGVTFKFFEDLNKYTQRAQQLKALEDNDKLNESVRKTLTSVSL